MGKLLVEEKMIVVPGEILAEGMDYLPGNLTYRMDENVIAKKLGLVVVEGRAVKIIPLSGRYLPKIGDKIIGQVTDIAFSGWSVNTNSAYKAMLSMRDASTRFIRKGDDLTRYFDIGDYILAKIINVTSQNLIDLTMKEPGLRKLSGGRIVKVNPNKVPRVIGKQGSMVSLIKEKTGCNISVGQNGLVWIGGGDFSKELKAAHAVEKIGRESHLEGLTERITTFLGA